MVSSSSAQFDRFLMNYSKAATEDNYFKSEILALYIIKAQTTVFASLPFGYGCVFIRIAYAILSFQLFQKTSFRQLIT